MQAFANASPLLYESLGLEPIFPVVPVEAASPLIELIGPASDLFLERGVSGGHVRSRRGGRTPPESHMGHGFPPC